MILARPARRPAGEHIVPLINVVFLLLIFVMLAGRMAQPEPFKVTPPDANAGKTARVSQIVVLISADGRIAVDGAPTERRSVGAAVRAASSGGLRIVVKADRNAEAVAVIGVLEALKALEIETTELVTQAGGG